jgi:(p)ppGpp synthase/HD superfamily hydrolase
MPSLWSQEKYIKALVYASQALNNTPFPRSNLPFAVHLSLISMEIMATLQVESGLDGDLALQCALLHDVIDYSSKTYEDVREKFGDNVAVGVQALSKLHEPEFQNLTNYLTRIRQQPREIWIVKMADKITNIASPPEEWTPQILESYKKDAKQTNDTLKAASAFLSDRLLKLITASE